MFVSASEEGKEGGWAGRMADIWNVIPADAIYEVCLDMEKILSLLLLIKPATCSIRGKCEESWLRYVSS